MLSLNHPVKLFIDNSTDVAENLRQEFIRIKKSREEDRTAIVVGTVKITFIFFGGFLSIIGFSWGDPYRKLECSVWEISSNGMQAKTPKLQQVC